MESSKFSNFFQNLTSIAVLVGIILVFYEIQQTRQLMSAQLAADSFALRIQHSQARLGENSAEVLAKVCVGKKLSSEETMVLIADIEYRLQYAQWKLIVQELTDFDKQGYENAARDYLVEIFISEHGRKYWELAKSSHSMKLQGLASEASEIAKRVDCSRVLQTLMMVGDNDA